jgi:tetratricopeptide (TPR) repeat protein
MGANHSRITRPTVAHHSVRWIKPAARFVVHDGDLESVRLDPHYAPAWARLGRVYRMMAKYADAHDLQLQRRAEDAFRRALAINPELSVAHCLYAQLEMETGRTREAFVRLLDRARERRADPQLFAGLVQASRYVGLLDASRAAHARARKLDPTVKTSIGYTSIFAGDYENAAAEARENDDPLEAFAYALIGRTSEATKGLESLRQAYGDSQAWAIYIDIATAFVSGDHDALVSLADAALRMPFGDPEGLFQICLLLVMSHEPSRALIALKRTVDAGFPCPAALESHPTLQSLRKFPDFEVLRKTIERKHQQAVEAFDGAGGLALLA